MFRHAKCQDRSLKYCPRLEQLETRVVPAVLYRNGDWVTGIGNGFGGANRSEIESGFVTYGFNASTPSFHVADDFTVPANVSAWQVSRVKVYGYQRFAPANENTFTKLHLKIYQGDPAAGGTVVVDCTGPNAINVSNSNVFANTYRVSSANPLASDRAVKEITGNLCSSKRFTPGTYWLEWSAEGSSQYNPPFANVTVPWNAPDNGKQFVVADGTWKPMIDPPEQGGTGKVHDIPFELHGRAGAPFPTLNLGLPNRSVAAVPFGPVRIDLTPARVVNPGEQVTPTPTSPEMEATPIRVPAREQQADELFVSAEWWLASL